MFKYFTISPDDTIDSIKKQYKKLAFKYHPDMGGSNEEMKAVITEYELALQEIGKVTGKNYKLDLDYVSIIDDLINLHMENVEIEVCGWFIYLWGNTRVYKEDLKKLKFFWNNKKKCWYWKPSWYVRRGGKTWEMDRIRSTYGSQFVENEKKKEDKKSPLNPAPVF